jgi:hypothetical protein
MEDDMITKIINAKIDEVIVIENHTWLKSVKFDLTREGAKEFYSFVYYSKSREWDSQFPLRTTHNVQTWKTLNGAKRYFIEHFLKEHN